MYLEQPNNKKMNLYDGKEDLYAGILLWTIIGIGVLSVVLSYLNGPR